MCRHVEGDLRGARAGRTSRPGSSSSMRRPVRAAARLARDRTLLLPSRPQGLPRPRLLPRAVPAIRRAGRLRAGVRHRARVRPPRPEPARRLRDVIATSSRRTRTGEQPLRCGSSCRRTASPGVGPYRLRAGELEQGDLEEGLAAAARSATTASNAKRRGESTASRGRTGPRSSVSRGSARASTRAIPAPATRSRAASDGSSSAPANVHTPRTPVPSVSGYSPRASRTVTNRVARAASDRGAISAAP